jgi:enediyne biosynthesis protein E4
MRVHFGLGAATKIDSVEVRWPSGLVENFSKIQVDKFNELNEGAGTAAK